MVTINKNTISTFLHGRPLIALATKSKIFDTSFSSTSELTLYNYKNKTQNVYKNEHKFCKIIWCHIADGTFLIAGHENGFISCYKLEDEELELLYCKQVMKNGDDVIDIDYYSQKKMICAISNTGRTLFMNILGQKEYFIDITVSEPSCITWNKKVSKILAIGTKSGCVKLIDIKKNSVIISSESYGTVKKLIWDDEIPTKMYVLSDKNVITEHELSNDIMQEQKCYGEKLITFNKDYVVTSEFIIDMSTDIRLGVKDILSCSLGQNVACLHHKDGATEIINIPKMPIRRGFCRFENKIFTGKKVFTIASKKIIDDSNVKNEGVDDTFYDELKNMDISTIPDYLLQHANEIPQCYQSKNTKNKIDVDLNNKIHCDIINGNYESLSNSNEKVDMKLLCAILNKDKKVLALTNTFEEVMIMSRLLEDVSVLGRISNSRILAAILLKNQLDINILSSSDKEGRILKGIILKNNEVIGDRIVLSDNFYENLAKIKKYLVNLDTPIESDYLSEYFWYMISQGKFDEVENLKVNDSKIQRFIQAKKNRETNNYAAINSTMQQRTIRQPMMNQQTPVVGRQPVIKAPSMNNPLFANRMVPGPNKTPQQSINQGMPNRMMTPQMPQRPPMQQPNQNPLRSSTSPVPQRFAGPAQTNIPQRNPIGTPGMMSRPMPRPNNQGFPTPPSTPLQRPGMMNNQGPMRPQMGGMMPGSTPNVQGISNKIQAMKPPMMQKPPIVNNSMSNIMRNVSSSMNNLSNMPGSQASSAMNNLDVPRILNEFDQLINQVKQRVAMKNSILLNQKKTKFLNGLDTYVAVDKNTLSPDVLNAMDTLIQRMSHPDNNLKFDLDKMNLSCTGWLKSLIELIKIGY